MAIIEVNDLTKTYRVFQKKEGVLGANARALPARL